MNTLPKIGNRFLIKEVEFEITYVECANLRYSSVAGGKINNLTIIKYQNLLSQGKIKLLRDNNISDSYFPDQLTDNETNEMNHRLSYVKEVFNNTQHPTSRKEVLPVITAVANAMEDSKPPSHATICRWIKAYISSNRDPMSLVPRTKKKGNRYFRFDPNIERIIKERIQKDYLTQQRLSAKAVYANIKAAIYLEYKENIEFIQIPSERSINRRISAIDPYKLSRGRDGMYVANKEYKAAGRGVISTRILETVEADGNFLDVLIIDEETGEVIGRPYGTCLIDKYSRCIISFVVTMIPFSSATLLKALKVAISGNNEKFGGLFESMIVDNGSDYISQSVRNFCNHTGIRIEHGAPRDPNSKPHVERFFGTLNTQLIHMLPGTTFSNPTEKADYKSEEYSCLTLIELNNFIEQWLDNVYHKTIHRGHGRAPEKLWRESAKNTPLTIYPLKHLDTIAREIEIRHISKGRVTIHNLQWFSNALASIEQDCKNKGIPTKVDVYIDSLDLGRVFIKDPRDHSIFIQADAVFPNYANGLTLYEHKIIKDNLKEKGKKDLISYGEHYLEIAKWQLFESIEDHRKNYSKKRIARIKETNKQIKDAKLLKSKTSSIRITKNISQNSEINQDIFIPPKLPDNSKKNGPDDSDSFTFERF